MVAAVVRMVATAIAYDALSMQAARRFSACSRSSPDEQRMRISAGRCSPGRSVAKRRARCLPGHGGSERSPEARAARSPARVRPMRGDAREA